ncbi:MAG: glycine cleavage system aminomethyltransferase GcvT [Methylococcaceae bacterium]|nr:glycine cleavage system aminomethyltransferase GcvT [Methylococcaceae bacterium]
MNAIALKHTPLHDLHRELGATMVPYAGYEMPVRFTPGILGEHLHTRAAAGLFDVSHMGLIRIEGESGLYERFERLVSRELQSLPPGTCRYALLLNDQGGALDDLMITRPGNDRDSRTLYLIVNAACKERDLAHIRAGLGERDRAELLEDSAILGLQGPAAAEILSHYCDAPSRLKFMHSGQYTLAGFGEAIVSRSGYTGEDGFEIALDCAHAQAFARSLLARPEVMMVGLGARDTLRLEAGLPLYGHDLDETTTPVEAGFSWMLSRQRLENGGFPGAEILRRQWLQGPARRLMGIRPQDKTIAREQTELQLSGNRVGIVTSGGFGPSIQGPIAMGYVESAHARAGTSVDLIVRGKAVPAQIVALPFVPHRYVR